MIGIGGEQGKKTSTLPAGLPLPARIDFDEQTSLFTLNILFNQQDKSLLIAKVCTPVGYFLLLVYFYMFWRETL